MRVAVVQCAPVFNDATAACDVIVDRMRWATREAVDLLVFPEVFLLGHSYDPATIHRCALEAAPALAELCRRVAGFPVTLMVGAFEAAPPLVYNSAFVIEDGQITGRYAKAYPNEPGVTAGYHYPTFVRALVRYGINICNDANHPDAAVRIARQGAHLIVYPLNNLLPAETAERWRERSLANLVERASQSGCWIASSDVTGTSGRMTSYGCTTIVAPDGRLVARVPELVEGAVIHDIPLRLPG